MNGLWKKQQTQALDEWYYYQKDGEKFYNLIEQSMPIIIDNIKIETGKKLLGDTDVYLKYNMDYCSLHLKNSIFS